MIYDADTMARGWLAVAQASGKDDWLPVLSRTVLLEQHPTGLRLVATDSWMLLTSFIPAAEHGPEHEPEIDEAPTERAVAMDLDGRGAGLMKYAVKRARAAAKEDEEAPEMRIRLNQDTPHPDGPAQLDGMGALSVVLEMPDVERVVLPVFGGDYPPYPGLLLGLEGVSTDRIALHPDRVSRLCAAAQHVGGQIGWTFGGEARAARVDMINADPALRGLVQPVRWDWWRNEPRVENPEAPPTEELDEDGAPVEPAAVADTVEADD